MQLPTIPNKLPMSSTFNRLSQKQKMTTAGALAATALVLSVTGLEATAGAGSASAASAPTGSSVSAPQHVAALTAPSGTADPVTKTATGATLTMKTVVVPTAHTMAAKPTADKHAPAKAAAKAKPAKHAAAHKAAAPAHAKKVHAAPRPAVKTYPNDLDGWIRQSLDILHAKGIPASYSGIHRNIMRESSGNPNAINLWDINAKNGIPSKGLLQVINPTFNRYHVAGTSWNIYNPVANITAACNYAADRYGSMDNVNSAY
ncbi:Transglycosylase SLT domain-containing protein [Streptomyces sp. DvalAA-14]|uniref:transglycosylase SLT domain-containing protein n=1 Tax=unclassified Streptomyces TaxID=2593676 RepID=UPI00081B371A|nr:MULTISPECIES: transglycosylase SLT domain-containing protein [unclassified Streptomyces]MYS23759.1 transglycosylase SLT domain-containing protein [Streptomyces sp. SID4948]SCE38369.1 Transglycosylase SLT domain-containing protein [Streptomyces sp. DvalAA-14]